MSFLNTQFTSSKVNKNHYCAYCYKKTTLLVAALLAVYLIVHYVKEFTCLYKLSPSGAERQKCVEKVQCNYTVHKVLHVVSWALYACSQTVMDIAILYTSCAIAVQGISLPGYVIGLAVSRKFLIPIIPRVIDAVPFEAGVLSTSGLFR